METVLKVKSLLGENTLDGTGRMNRVRKAVGVRVGEQERGKSMGKGPEEARERGILEGLKNGLCNCSREREVCSFL